MFNNKVIDFASFKNKTVTTIEEYYYSPIKIEFYYLIKSQELVINDNSLMYAKAPSSDKKVNKNKNKALLQVVNDIIKEFNEILIINFGETKIIDYTLAYETFKEFLAKNLIKEDAQISMFTAMYDVQSADLAIYLLANTELFKDIKTRDAWVLNNKLTGEAMPENFPYIFLYLFYSAKKHYENLLNLDVVTA